MICTFVLLLIVLITLIFYYSERSRFLSKVEDLTTNLQTEMEERLNLESKYNKILNDFKKEEELNKNKKLDETQLMFTKVNMLDDKLTYFNTTFKAKLENIIELLGIQKSDKIKNIEEIVLDDKTQNIDENSTEENLQEQIEETNQEVNSDKQDNIETLKKEVFSDIIQNDESNETKENTNIEELNDSVNYATKEENVDEFAKNNTVVEQEEIDEENDEDDTTENSSEGKEGNGGIISNSEETKNEINQDNEEYLHLYKNNDESDVKEETNNYTSKKPLGMTEDENNGSSTDKEIEKALFEETNHSGINFEENNESDVKSTNISNSDDYINSSNMNLLELHETVNDNNEESKLEEESKANANIGEGFDIKNSIEKLKAQLEEGKK